MMWRACPALVFLMDQTEQKKSFLHIECEQSQKARFVLAASERKMKLADWVLEQLDIASKNSPGATEAVKHD